MKNEKKKNYYLIIRIYTSTYYVRRYQKTRWTAFVGGRSTYLQSWSLDRHLLAYYLGLVVSRERFVLALDREELEPRVLLCWLLLLVTIPCELRFE